jgi:hypothetical protein
VFFECIAVAVVQAAGQPVVAVLPVYFVYTWMTAMMQAVGPLAVAVQEVRTWIEAQGLVPFPPFVAHVLCCVALLPLVLSTVSSQAWFLLICQKRFFLPGKQVPGF